MNKCKCGSYAINKDRQHFTSSLSSCDLCHWIKRANYMEMHLFEILALIASFENERELGFKTTITAACDKISGRIEKYHMDEQEAAPI